MKGSGHALEELGRNSIWPCGLVRGQSGQALLVKLRCKGRENRRAWALSSERETVNVARVLPGEGRGRVNSGYFRERGCGQRVDGCDDNVRSGV